MSSKAAECSTSYSDMDQASTPTSTNITELTNKQVDRLRSVLSQNVEIHGPETLEIRLSDLIKLVRKKLDEAGLSLKCTKLNGGAATHVLASEHFSFSDIDLIFPISLANEDDFDKVRNAVFDALFSLMSIETTRTSIYADSIREQYISKMVKVSTEEDRWSLFSLHNDYGKCIELKFVDKMRRQFEFSVDSFQITLDRLLDHPDEAQPKVIAESVYGDIREALSHLNRYQIDTVFPHEIRGGGLLKYCHLMTRGFQPTQNCRSLEKYMVSRFFIDFSDIHCQEMKLRAYLDNHFYEDQVKKLQYLYLCHRIVKESCVCLMGHERRSTLNMIDRLYREIEYNMLYLNIQCDDSSSTQSGMSSPAPSTTPSSVSAVSTESSNSNAVQGGRSTLLYLAPNSRYWVPCI